MLSTLHYKLHQSRFSPFCISDDDIRKNTAKCLKFNFNVPHHFGQGVGNRTLGSIVHYKACTTVPKCAMKIEMRVLRELRLQQATECAIDDPPTESDKHQHNHLVTHFFTTSPDLF